MSDKDLIERVARLERYVLKEFLMYPSYYHAVKTQARSGLSEALSALDKRLKEMEYRVCCLEEK